MTPELEQMVRELYAWMQERKRQQISYPLDEASRNSLGAPVYRGAGAATLTQVAVDSNGDTVTVPAAYARSLILEVDGAQFEVPSLT